MIGVGKGNGSVLIADDDVLDLVRAMNASAVGQGKNEKYQREEGAFAGLHHVGGVVMIEESRGTVLMMSTIVMVVVVGCSL